jgi:hypothetical protein
MYSYPTNHVDSARKHLGNIYIYIYIECKMQTTFWCKFRANLLKKVSKQFEKNMNVHLSLHYLYTKFHGQIDLTLAITK